MQLFDDEAEQILIGSVLQFPSLMDEVTSVVRPDDFYSEKHRLIFDVILSELDSQSQADAILIINRLKEKNLLEKAGNRSYIMQLTSQATQVGITAYCRRVKELSIRRSLLASLREIEKSVVDGGVGVDDLLGETEKTIARISDRYIANNVMHLREMGAEFTLFLKRLQESKGITGTATHFRKFDELTGGLRGGQMIVLAARPGVGKTTFALNLAQNIAVKENKTILFFSLEMTRLELLLRMVCSMARLETQKILKGYGNAFEIKRLAETLRELVQKEIYIDESTDLTSLDFKQRSRRLANKLKAEGKPPLGLIVVDYLQLMTDKGGHDSRQTEVAAISRSVKLIAKELDVPVLALSQMNRAIEQRGKDPRPQLSDLRESGAIEQDADIVLFIHREEMFNPDTEKKGVAEIIVAKHRGGPMDKFEVAFLKNFNLFIDLDTTAPAE